MKIEIYAMKDTLVGYMQPFYQANKHVAMRNFKITVNHPESNLKDIAHNIELYKIGTFDDQTGEITNDIEYICKGIDVLEVNKED